LTPVFIASRKKEKGAFRRRIRFRFREFQFSSSTAPATIIAQPTNIMIGQRLV
jgi:hypothetical protein